MENSRWTGKVPQLRFAFAPCARSKSGLVLVPGRPLLLCLRREPPFFRSCDCTSERTAEEVDPTEFIDGTARCAFVCKCLSKKHFPPCLCLPPEPMWCPEDNPCPTTPISFSTNPPCSCAASALAAAAPTGATCAPAAPRRPRPPQPAPPAKRPRPPP